MKTLVIIVSATSTRATLYEPEPYKPVSVQSQLNFGRKLYVMPYEVRKNSTDLARTMRSVYLLGDADIYSDAVASMRNACEIWSNYSHPDNKEAVGSRLEYVKRMAGNVLEVSSSFKGQIEKLRGILVSMDSVILCVESAFGRLENQQNRGFFTPLWGYLGFIAESNDALRREARKRAYDVISLEALVSSELDSIEMLKDLTLRGR